MMRSAARRPLSVHPQLLARAALRGAHRLPQPERDHAGMAAAAGGRQADRPCRAVDAEPGVRPRSSTTRKADPHQIAQSRPEPAHRATLERMRGAVTDWMARIGDQGLVNEPEMIQRMWPGGVQPETAQPYIVPRRTSESPTRPARRDRGADGDRRSTCPRRAHRSATPRTRERTRRGVCIPDRSWSIGPMTLRAKAIRYGYKESAETRVDIRAQ